MTLATQQQALLETLFAWPAQEASQQLQGLAVGVGRNPQRGLKAYQANGHLLAERALLAAYPVVAQILGAESFANLAREFWHCLPPQCGDLAEWGQGLGAFVHGSVQLQDVPYLADVAAAEWALHRCVVACDREVDFDSLSLLTTDEPSTLAFQLAPGLASQSSAWPLASILLAHMQGSPGFAQVAEALQRKTSQDVVIWRAAYQPRVRQAQPGEVALLHALCAGQAIGPALDAVGQLDISQWLPMAVQTGLVLGVSRMGAVK